MAQRINPNTLKLGISKNPFFHVHSSSPLPIFHQDLAIKHFIKGFFYSFNFFSSNIILHRSFLSTNSLDCSFLLYPSTFSSLPPFFLSSYVSSLFSFQKFSYISSSWSLDSSFFFSFFPFSSLSSLSPQTILVPHTSSLFSSSSFYSSFPLSHLSFSLFTPVTFLFFLSSFLSKILAFYFSKSSFSLNIKLVHHLDRNIHILGQYLAKEILLSPYRYKFLFKSLLFPRFHK